MAEGDPRLQRGVERFNAGLYYEAHEVLEEAWNDAARRERFFVQALVHCAVAWHHATHENFEGAVLQARRAMRKLAGYLPEHGGIRTRALLAQLERWVEAWRRGAPAPRATIGVRR